MTFLSLLPENSRRRRLLLPIQSYMDESGVKGTDPIFVLGGFLGSSEMWLYLSDAWGKWMDEPPRIKYLKMSEAAKPGGQFRGWDESEITEKLAGFIDIIERFPPTRAMYIAVDLHAFREFRGKIPAPSRVADPWFFALDTLTSLICHEIHGMGVHEQAELIFDEHKIFGPRASLWYPVLRDLLVNDHPELEKILPASLIFRDDRRFLPLQLSDMLAWLVRMDLTKSIKPAFSGILGELLSVVPISPKSHFFDYESLQRVAHLAPSLTSDISPSWISSWNKKLGLVYRKTNNGKKR